VYDVIRKEDSVVDPARFMAFYAVSDLSSHSGSGPNLARHNMAAVRDSKLSLKTVLKI
jgi:hypothetical protein